jgi:hypothetical protein
MTRQRPDDDLHAAFQAERAVERGAVPPYAILAAGRPRRPARRVSRLLLAGAVAAASVGIMLLRGASPHRQIDVARRMMVNESPTDFLLETVGSALLDSVPRFGMSVPGSPLRALDPGGPLGPPLTRSPGL